ncbi:D-ribose pyranase [Megasphaera sp. DISK 18]|uniref:D-ribose pyranase n=1 Tax=Megasphaera sp. DISK 18 TaxID=1776081 RepID=UPI000806FBE0|nr:D-ribose pyranase [Megasphaera sp. DISK 18]OBZ32889.1 D-ribose pyranase [Megasphaera sp. DISK 18]
MKKKGIIHGQLAGALAALGHKDRFLLCDAGMPIPSGVPIIDLAVVGGVPTFRQVFDAIMDEIVVEKYVLAEEIKETNPVILEHLRDILKGAEEDFIPHVDLKKESEHVKFAVRTGEFSYYPNVILQAGVCF